MTLDEAVAEAEKIPGWMDPDELRWLGGQAQGRKVIVEVGSWQGRSTKVLAAMCPGVVYSIDNLKGEDGTPLPPPGQDTFFQQHLGPEIASRKVKVIRKPSIEASRAFRNKADMIFIDGNHEYPAPAEDILAWAPKLTKDGLLCGHDITIPGVSESVIQTLEGWYPLNIGSLWAA